MRSSSLLLALLPALAHAQAPLVLESPNPELGGSFGGSVSGVEDADGDGRGDLLVGAVYENGGASYAGRTYLFSGATGTLLHTLTSPNPEFVSSFGSAVSGVADADGDGHGDLLVGAWGEDVGSIVGAGRAYLYSGATGTLLRTLASPNPEVGGYFGYAVSGVADADGDGRGDLLVGAYLEDGGANGAGRAYLYSGATGQLLRTLTSPNPVVDGLFGSSVSGVADGDGDGKGDLLVGAYAEEGGGVFEAGRAYLYSGATGQLLHTLESPNAQPSGYFGSSASGVSDADGDGAGDLLVGAWAEDIDGNSYPDNTEEGRAYLYSGATGTLLHTLTPPNREPYGRFGVAVSGVPDADGDGRGDLLVSARYEDVGDLEYAGRAYLYSGATGTLLFTLESPYPELWGFFGYAVSGVADADGDGLGDLLVGAASEDTDEDADPFSGDQGRAYFFRSGGGLTVAASGSPTSSPPGGTVAVTATVTNRTADPVTGDLWVVAARDGGPALTQLVGSGPLAPADSVTVTFTLRSPGGTPPGVYAVTVNAGRFPDVVRAADAFDVAVTGGRLVGEVSAEPFVVEAVAGDGFVADASAAASRPPSSPSVVVSPNPFAERTALRFALAEPSAVRLSVHDALGREVARLLDGAMETGPHAAAFDGRGLAAGVYVWRLVAGGSVQTGRLTLLD